MISKDEAVKIVNEKLSKPNLIKHSFAVGAVMKGLARELKENEDIWELAGLLHDLDYEATENEPKKHGLLTEEWLREYDMPRTVIDIIKAHNSDALQIERKTLGEKAIFATDPVTGLIVAAALMNPEKKIKPLQLKSVLKKFKNLKFAAGANREHIRSCTDLHLSLEEFLDISLRAMQSIDEELGL